MGRRAFEEVLRKRHIDKPSPAEMNEMAGRLGFEDIRHLYAAIGAGDLRARSAAERIFGRETKPKKSGPPSQEPDRRLARGVRVVGSDKFLVRFPKCCQPVPGDSIVGYITRGRGITIHRADCHNTFQVAREPERRVDADWAPGPKDRYPVGVIVAGRNRSNLLADLSKAISDLGTNIVSVNIGSDKDSFEGSFLLEVDGAEHLERVLSAATRVHGVTLARRDNVARSAKKESR